MARRKSISRKITINESFDDEDIIISVGRIRAKSYPEDLIRASLFTKPFKTKTINYKVQNNNQCNNNLSIPKGKRLKSSGELQTALLTMAIREGDVMQLWRLLSRKDIDVNHIDGFGLQPVHYACLYGEVDILKILTHHGIDVNAMTFNGECPLDIAVSEGNFEVAQYLVNKGAKVNTIVDGIKKKSLIIKNTRPLSTGAMRCNEFT